MSIIDDTSTTQSFDRIAVAGNSVKVGMTLIMFQMEINLQIFRIWQK